MALHLFPNTPGEREGWNPSPTAICEAKRKTSYAPQALDLARVQNPMDRK